MSKYFYIVSINILESYYIMAKTRKRQIKQRGGGPCLFVLGGIIDSINNLIKAINRVKIKEFEKIKEININFYTNVANAFDSQINASCTDIKKSDYASLIKQLTTLSVKFQEKQNVFSDDTQGYLTRIETMKTRASELSESIIEPPVYLPNPPPAKSKTVKKKTSTKVVENTIVMPPLPPTLSSVAAATTEEKAAKEAQKNAKKKENRAARKAAEQAAEEARKAAAEEATRKKIAKTIANEAASKIAAKNANEAAKEEAIKVANEYIKIAAKNAEKKINIKATVKRLAEKDKKKAAEEEAAKKAAAKKAAEEARINDITFSIIKLFFDGFTKYRIDPLGIITQEQANKYVTTLFPNVKFTNKITDSTPTQTKMTQPDSENYMYYSYLYMIYIGILNNYLHILTKNNPYDLFAGLKLVFKGGRAAQIMLPKEGNLLSDDTDIFLQSTNIEHTPFFLKTFAFQLAKSWSKSQQLISGIGKVNPNIVKIAYKSLTGLIPISDIDFGSPTYPQYYDDIKTVHKKLDIIQETLIDATTLATKLATTLAPRNISLHLVYYHQSPESFFAEKREIYNLYSNPFYKNCNCRDLLHTEECVASCSERQFYLDKFKKYVDVKTTPSSFKRKTQKNKSVSSV